MMGFVAEDDNTYYSIANANSASNRGIKTHKLLLNNAGAHTQVRITVEAWGTNGEPGLRTLFNVYDGNGVLLNEGFSGRASHSYMSYDPLGLARATYVWYKDINQAGASYAVFMLNQRRTSTGELNLDNILVEYVHTYTQQRVSDEVASEGTCNSPATYYIKCDHCDKLARDDSSYTGEIAKSIAGAVGHDEGTPVVENNVGATCTAAGGYDTVVYCTVCDEEISRVHTTVPVLEHAWDTGVYTQPTTTADGYTTYTCGTCGATKVEIDEGSVKTVLTFTLINNGTAYAVTDCDSAASEALVIPATYKGKPVTSIADSAFYLCIRLTSVTIPDSVTSIGASAFACCTNLTSISIGSGVTSIGERAFYKCTSLISVTIPDNVTSIGQWAFAHSTALASVTMGKGITGMSDYVHRCIIIRITRFTHTLCDSHAGAKFSEFFGCILASLIRMQKKFSGIDSRL